MLCPYIFNTELIIANQRHIRNGKDSPKIGRQQFVIAVCIQLFKNFLFPIELPYSNIEKNIIKNHKLKLTRTRNNGEEETRLFINSLCEKNRVQRESSISKTRERKSRI